jgi:hypothetical protein
LALKECLLNELKQKEDGSGVTDYDESLYTNIKKILGPIQHRTVDIYSYMHNMWKYFYNGGTIR